MAWGMVFGVLVTEVGDYEVTIYLEFLLADAIHDPLETHVDLI